MDYRDNRQRWAESHQVVHFYAGQWCAFTPALTEVSCKHNLFDEKGNKYSLEYIKFGEFEAKVRSLIVFDSLDICFCNLETSPSAVGVKFRGL